jgi:arylsulfatase A
VPCIAWWPGRIAAGSQTDATTMTMDLLPTYLDLLGIAPPPTGDPQALDGVSLAPLLLRGETPADRTLFWRTGDFKAVRRGPWKLVIEHGDTAKLYRLDRDLGEEHDLAATETERLRELLAALAEWERGLER